METLTIPFGFLSFSRVIRRIGLLFPAPQLTLVTRINIFGHYGAREIVNLDGLYYSSYHIYIQMFEMALFFFLTVLSKRSLGRKFYLFNALFEW